MYLYLLRITHYNAQESILIHTNYISIERMSGECKCYYSMKIFHDVEEEDDLGGTGIARGVFNVDESSKRESSGSLRGDVCTGVFGFSNKSGTLMFENEDSVDAGTGESIDSFKEGVGTVTGSDDADCGCGDGDDLLLGEDGLMVMCSRLAWSTTW